MAYIPDSGSVVAFQGTVPFSVLGEVTGSVISVQQGSVAAVIIGGSIAASFTPPANQSVSGTVQTQVQGSVATVIIGGSVSATLTPPANQSVSGTVGASIIGLPPVNVTNIVTVVSSIAGGIFPVSGSVAAVVTNFPANQSVSGTVGASIIGAIPVTFVNSSISGTVTVASTVAIGNTVQVNTELPNAAALSDTTANPTTPMVGAAMMTWDGNGSVWTRAPSMSVAGTVNVGNFPTNQNVSGSVVSFQGGTQITSLVSTVPSSVIVGASIFGQLPAGTAVIGSVATLQGTNPWIVNYQNSSIIAINAGSVVTIVPGSVITLWQSPSIVGTYSEDAAHTSADKGIFTLNVRNDTVASFVSANLEYSPTATDSAGRILTKPFSAEESRVEGYNSVVSTSVTTLIPAAGTGLRNYITDMWFANSGATTALITLRSGGGASVLGYTIAPAGGGSNLIALATPIRTGVNETFDFQATSASSILFGTAKGFKAP